VGIDVNAGNALVESNDLTGNTTAAIRVQNGGIVDAGDCSGNNVTGLGTGSGLNGSSAGLNDLTGYLTGDAKAVINSSGTAFAQNDNFGAAAGRTSSPRCKAPYPTHSPAACSSVLRCRPSRSSAWATFPAGAGTLAGFVGLGGTASCSSATVSFSDSSLDPGPYEGTVTRTYTLTDACGQTNAAIQIITVDDTVPPTITGPLDVAVNADAGQCYATGVALGVPLTNDNCGVASVSNDAPLQFPVAPTSSPGSSRPERI